MNCQLRAWADPVQEGFTRGSQVLNNVGRVTPIHVLWMSDIIQNSLLLLFDFAAAFPLLANVCYGLIEGITVKLYDTSVCILDSCPVSGSLFVTAVDTFYRKSRSCCYSHTPSIR